MSGPSNRPSSREFFSVHAEDYAKSDSHAHGSDLALLVRLLKPEPFESALDVAAGTGFTSIELAKHVRQVVALDMTREMLVQAEKLARNSGISNIRFEVGEAERLPFPDSSFDIVTTRRAAHHFNSVDNFLGESRRVLKPNGRIGIVDMSPPDGAQDFFNSVERLRDSSHTAALTPSEWQEKVKRAGFQILTITVLSEPLTFQRWLYPVKMDGKEEMMIREKLKETPDAVATALKLTYADGQVAGWNKDRIVLIASSS